MGSVASAPKRVQKMDSVIFWHSWWSERPGGLRQSMQAPVSHNEATLMGGIQCRFKFTARNICRTLFALL